MTEENLKKLLQNADKSAGRPFPVELEFSVIRKKARHRQIYRLVFPAAAAAMIIFAVSIWSLSGKKTDSIEPVNETIQNDNDTKIKLLLASTDNAINLIQEIIAQEDSQKGTNILEAKLAATPDPLEEVQEQLDRTAFILVYSADKMYNELNLTVSAVETYKRVIKLFPDNQWAKVAKERLEEIKNRRNNDSSKGESKWKQQNTLS